MREAAIRIAIENLSGKEFEDFANELLRRELYPGLNPTSASHDLGEDARTEPSVILMHNGKAVSIVASKTCTWAKLRKDCLRCQKTARRIDILVFATSGDPQTDQEEIWRQRVEAQFGWSLEIRSIRWLLPVANAPIHESLVDERLHIPPPNGDFVQNIDQQFAYHTQKALQRIRLQIPGIADPLPRREVAWIEEQLGLGKSVVLTGDAGTGKSGIAAQLIASAEANGSATILLDARRVGSCQNEGQVRQHLGLKGPVAAAVQRMGRYRGCRVIIDQMDSVVGSPAAQLLVELAMDVSGCGGVQVVVISRRNEKHEQAMVRELLDAGFVELASHPLGETESKAALLIIGIPGPAPNLVDMARNLLNLELIGLIKDGQPDIDFGMLTNEAELWEQYFRMLQDREQTGVDFESAESIIAEARKLAWVGLESEEGDFCLEDPMARSRRRLVSWDVIQREDGQVYRFRHEKLQDFLCAWDAVEKHWMPRHVLGQVGPHRSRNILVWMDRLYARGKPELRRQFMKEIFYG